jgi:hypothetical protein
MNRARIFQSNGELIVRAYAIASVRPRIVAPLIEVARVEIVDPRRTATLRDDRPRGPGPRDPAQNEWRAPKPPGIELPDRRPIMKTQRFFIDPELFEQWEQEEQSPKRTGTR